MPGPAVPALLVEMTKDSGFKSLVALLRLKVPGAPWGIRTISLNEALNRMNRFIHIQSRPG